MKTDTLKDAQRLKEIGNNLFKNNKLAEAISSWDAAASMLLQEAQEDAPETEKIEELQEGITRFAKIEDQEKATEASLCLSNIAQAQLNQQNWKAARYSAEFASSLAPNPKADFRAAKAYVALRSFGLAERKV